MEKDKKYVVISGGCGGLGRAAAEYFAKRGCGVFSLDIRKNGTPFENITEIETDITDIKSVENAYKEIEKTTERLSCVISLAGIYFMDSLIEVPEEELLHIFDVNFFGVYRVNKVFLPLIRNGNGRVLITTSELAGMKALPFNGIYSCVKTALGHYTDSLRQELALIDVPVTEILPGAFDTGMISASFASLDSMSGKTKLYATNTERFKSVMKTQSGGAKPPVILAQALYRAAFSRRPYIRMKIHNNFLLKLFNLFPRGVQVRLISMLIKTK